MATARSVLDRFTAGKVETEEGPKEYEGLRPHQPINVIRPGTSKFAEKFANMTITIPDLPQEFEDIRELKMEVTSRDDFPDDYWVPYTAISLKRISEEEVLARGRELFSRLKKGVSQYHIGCIFLLAYQLRMPGMGNTVYLMPEQDELAKINDVDVSYLDDVITEDAGGLIDPVETGSIAQIAQGYAYLAASMLRMFTRSADNFILAWKHILLGYQKFYSANCPISGVQPDITVIRNIHGHFSLSNLLKITLYRFLYNANRDGKISNLQRYLYDIHLSHTGMHVVPIAYRICTSMNCSPDILIRVINANRFRPQILGLITAFKLMRNTDDKHKRMMWKYGRIFDSDFLAALQTKTCPKFVYLLACILQKENSKSASGILKIKQLEEVSPSDQDRLDASADLLIKAINTEKKESFSMW